MVRFSFLFLLLAGICAAKNVKVRPENWAQPVLGSSLENFYRISGELYRSEQPKPHDISDLQQLGIRTVLSLRHYHADSPAFERAAIGSMQYEMDAGSVSVAELITVLRLIRTAPKPILVHCWHGSDRTGFVIAGYRMVFMNWTADEAIDELRLGGFGLHETWYPNIARVLKAMNVSAVRAAVFKEDVPRPPTVSQPEKK